MKKKRIYKNPDPEKYIIVRTKEGDILRKRRTNPSINDALKVMSAETCSTAAKQIVTQLKPYTENMRGRVNVRLSGKMRSANRQTGRYDYSQLLGFEYQQYHPLENLYECQYQVGKARKKIYIDIHVGKGCIKAQNTLVTHYYFEAVALFGDAMKPNSLQVEDDVSPLFDFRKTYNTTVRFSFVLRPATPYLIWLKAGCREGHEEANHPKHFAMRVVAVG
jgi:Mg2+ and Co2+ transporter CorA